MTDYSTLIAGVVLLLLLMAVALKGWLAARQLQEPASSEEHTTDQYPEELAFRIFSRADWEFVRGLKSHSIERLFKQERKNVALIWVRQLSAMVRTLMREHAEAARRSKDLRVATEINILARFLMLMAVCVILSVAIQIAGPVWLGQLAHLAQRLSQRLTKLQESFETVALERAGGAGSA